MELADMSAIHSGAERRLCVKPATGKSAGVKSAKATGVEPAKPAGVQAANAAAMKSAEATSVETTATTTAMRCVGGIRRGDRRQAQQASADKSGSLAEFAANAELRPGDAKAGNDPVHAELLLYVAVGTTAHEAQSRAGA